MRSYIDERRKRKQNSLQEVSKLETFEQSILPHLAAAYNLARWLTRNAHDAEDVVQEAYLRAFRFFGGFRGGDSRSRLLTIVRNTCYTWMQQNRSSELSVDFDAETERLESKDYNPEMKLLKTVDSQLLKHALEGLPVELRETLVLRELEGLSYKEIADIADIPIGTVMSRLARARKRLQQCLTNRQEQEAPHEVY